jgi:hypothetical protein
VLEAATLKRVALGCILDLSGSECVVIIWSSSSSKSEVRLPVSTTLTSDEMASDSEPGTGSL